MLQSRTTQDLTYPEALKGKIICKQGKKLTGCLVWLKIDCGQVNLLQVNGEVPGSLPGRSGHLESR